MAYPTDTDFPGAIDAEEDRTDNVDIIWADDFNYQDSQIRKIQQFLGETGKMIGQNIASSGPVGMVSPVTDGGSAIAFKLVARDSFTTSGGKLFSVGDDYDSAPPAYTQKFGLDKDGIVEINPIDPLPSAGTQGRLAYKSGTGEGVYVDNGSSWGQVGVDTDAIHDNVAGEIDSIASEKTALVGADLFLIEDSEDSNNKKKVQISNLPDDATAIHTDETGEINALSDKATPAGGDVIVVEDSEASYAKKKVSVSNLPSTDSNAIHDNTANEISALTEKASPDDADLVVIEDSGASYVKKKVQLSNLPGSGGGGGAAVAALDETLEMGAVASEIDLGMTTYDGSSGASHTFKAIIEPSAAVTCEIRIYDRGPVAGPATVGQLVAKLVTSTAGLQVLSETLTASGSPTFPDNNEIYNTDRMYQVRGYISGSLGDTLYVGKVSLALA